MARKLPKRVLVIGLDCAAPRFVFGASGFHLPHLRRLMAHGCWGPLRSCDPPITVPAWACMMSGKDPGELGCYGFRNRVDHSYAPMVTVNAEAIREWRLWDIVSAAGKTAVVVGVPQTWPARPLNGYMVADFPGLDSQTGCTYPKALRAEIDVAVGGYLPDVGEYRTDNKPLLRKQLFELVHNRFDTAEYLMRNKPWDFFMVVDMGVDRLHHGFWRYTDPAHPGYMPDNPYERVVREYYEALDARIGALWALAGEDTAVVVVSDHGAKALQGGVCINTWLIEQGWLRLQHPVAESMRIEDCDIDWSVTKAWGDGGYYGRIFINVMGREPAGIVAQAEYDAFRDQLAKAIEAMVGPDGRGLGNRVLKPEVVYRCVKGVAPDLLVYFGDLDWRAIGRVGGGSLFTVGNDTGPDDANHDFEGIFILNDGIRCANTPVSGVSIYDVAPTVLDLFGLPPTPGMRGRVIGHELF